MSTVLYCECVDCESHDGNKGCSCDFVTISVSGECFGMWEKE
jgi:hypothetical protein